MNNYEAFKKFLDAEGFKYDDSEIGDSDHIFRIPQKIQNGGIMSSKENFNQEN